MSYRNLLVFSFSALATLGSVGASAGAFIGASESNPDLILHPSGYSPGNQNLVVDICISPSSAQTTTLEVPVQNAIETYNALQATTNNLFLGGSNDVPSGRIDAESVLVHEMGHCLGLAHVNLASESGLTGSAREYTKSTLGSDGNYDLNDGADNVIGSSDDLRDDDTNLHYFKTVDNNPFTLAGTIDSSTYSRFLGNLPSGNYAANASRDVAVLLGVAGTESVMQQGTFVDEAQRSLTADDVATLSYGKSGVDEVAGTSDDYSLTLNYRGITNAGCDVTITVDNNTGFAVCEVGFQSVASDHFRISSATIRLNQGTNWHYNQTPINPINLAPTLDPITDVLTNEEEFVSIPINGGDEDTEDTLTLSSLDAPSFCLLNDNNDGTGALDCFPVVGDEGVYPITVTITDDGDPVQSASQSFTLTVLPEGVAIITECRLPFLPIPDNTGQAAMASFSFADTRLVVDLDVSVTVAHPFISDITASLTHVDTGTSALLIDRAGIPASATGCDGTDLEANFNDEGTDGPAEDLCAPGSPAIGGNLTPVEALSIFDDESIDGDWQLSLTDEATGDVGTLFEWCITATVIVAPEVDSDGDGVFDSTDNCTLLPNPLQEDTNADGIGNLCDADFNNDCIVNFADIGAFAPAFNSATGDSNYNPDIDIDSSGTVSFIDFSILIDSFLEVPGPSANECVPESN